MKGEQLIMKHRDKLAAPLSISLLVIGCISTFITVIILYSSIKRIRSSKKRVSVDLKISLGILTINFLISVTLVIVGAMSRFRDAYIMNNKWYCSFTLIFYMSQTYISIYWVGLLSIERGLLIIHNIKLSDKFWIFIMLSEFIYFLTLSGIGISKDKLGVVNLGYTCMIMPNFSLGKITTYSYLILMLTNFVCMAYCYLGIGIKLRIKAYKDIQRLNLNKEQTLRQANRTICKVIATLVIYIGFNSLEVVNLLIEAKTGTKRPSLLDLVSANLMSIEPIVNSLILVQFHDSVRLSLLETFPLIGRVFKSGSGDNNLNQDQFNNFESV